MAMKEIPELVQEQILECDRLGKLLRLKRKLFHLYHMEQTRDCWEESLNQAYIQCSGKESSEERQMLQKLKEEVGEDIFKLIK
jgi:hypothetical protein